MTEEKTDYQKMVDNRMKFKFWREWDYTESLLYVGGVFEMAYSDDGTYDTLKTKMIYVTGQTSQNHWEWRDINDDGTLGESDNGYNNNGLFQERMAKVVTTVKVLGSMVGAGE